MHMVGHGMPLDQFNTHLLAEFSQDLADILAERPKDCFLPIFRYDDDVVSAIPPDMVWFVLYRGGFPPDNMARIPPKPLLTQHKGANGPAT
jgi:hypothetical protein